MVSSLFRKLPIFKGKHRLARLLFSSSIATNKNLLVTGSYGIKYKIPNLKENVGFDIYIDGAYEKQYINYLVKNIPVNGILLDLGANIGSICIPVATLRPDITILAVEASPRVFSYLKYNIELNSCKNIFYENYALSVKDNEQVSFYSPEEKFGKGSMSPVYTDKAEYVTTITVDTLVNKYKFNKVDFIKIDVEGYESFVFRGGQQLLSAKDAPPVLFEFAHWAENLATETKAGDAQNILLSQGYKLYNLNDPSAPVLLQETLVKGTFMLLANK